MLASSGKRVDDVMVIVRGNWEFGEGEDRLNPVPRKKGKPGGRLDHFGLHICMYMYLALCSPYRFGCAGNDLKKVLVSYDDVVLAEIKTTLQFVGRPNLQIQVRVAHILLRY